MKTNSHGAWIAIAAIGILLGAAGIIAFSDNATGVGYSVKMKPIKLNHPTSFLLTAVWNIPDGVPVDDIEPDDGYLGWCVDADQGLDMTFNTEYDATMWYSYDANLPSYLTDTELWPEINWVINNKGSLDSYELQDVIWHLSGTRLWPYTSGVVYDMIQAALTHSSYMPSSSDDVVAWILYISDSRQTTIIEVPFTPEEEEEDLSDETAWAYGEYTFIGKKIGKNWGWLFEYSVGDNSASDPYETEFYAGAGKNVISKGYDAGEVQVWDDGDYLYVKYILSTDVYMTESHIYVGEDFPDKASPGLFPYGDDDLNFVTGYTEMIDLDDFDDDDLILAVHGVVWA